MVYGENEEACGNAGPLVVSRENCKDFLEMCGKIPDSGEKVFTFPKTEGRECLGWGDLPALWRLLCTEEERLDILSIEDWFSETPQICGSCASVCLACKRTAAWQDFAEVYGK